jgi:phospholipid transport system substrate-binding protein
MCLGGGQSVATIDGEGLMAGLSLGRRGLLRLVVLAVAVCPRWATAIEPSGVTAPIEKFYAELLAVMRAGRTVPFTQRFDALAPALERAINLQAILETAVGLSWTTFQPSQQSELQSAFKRYTVASWTSNFDSYSGQRLEVAGVRSMGSAQVVHTEIVKTSGAPSVIDFVMREAEGVWKATDVLLDGTISQVAVLRSDFRTLLARGPIALAANLEQKATELMGGTAPM